MATVNTHCVDLESGSSQYLSRADEALISITGNLTIECWIQFESLPASDNTMNIVGKTAASNASYVFKMLNPSGVLTLAFTNSVNGTDLLTASVAWTASTGVWYHVAVVYTAAGGTADFYVNGVQQGTQQSGLATSIFDGTAALHIGAANAGDFFDGKIDDVRLWSTTRTAANILDNIRVEIDSATNLVGSWHLNNALTDSSGNALTLTNNGVATFSTQVPWFEISDTTGAATESVIWEHAISPTDTAGTPTETVTNKYGWGNLVKSSASWSNQSKS